MANYDLQGVNVVMNNATYTMNLHTDGNTPSEWTRASLTVTNAESVATINFAGLVMGDATVDPVLFAELESMVTTFIDSFEI